MEILQNRHPLFGSQSNIRRENKIGVYKIAENKNSKCLTCQQHMLIAENQNDLQRQTQFNITVKKYKMKISIR